MTRLELKEAIINLGLTEHEQAILMAYSDQILAQLDLYIESQLAEKQKTIDLFTLEILTLRNKEQK